MKELLGNGWLIYFIISLLFNGIMLGIVVYYINKNKETHEELMKTLAANARLIKLNESIIELDFETLNTAQEINQSNSNLLRAIDIITEESCEFERKYNEMFEENIRLNEEFVKNLIFKKVEIKELEDETKIDNC